MTGLLVVTNAAAGSARDDAVDAAVGELRRRYDVQVAACADPADLAGILDGRAGRGLVVVGGDGSVHTVVGALHARGELSATDPLGLLPMGTGNDLARTLGIPLDPVEAARALVSARPRPLDLVVGTTATGSAGAVVNAVHLGIGAEAAQAAADLKPRLGKAAYPLASLVTGLRSRAWPVRVEVDGEVVHDDAALLVGVANGRSIGGGYALAPDAAPDDGRLDVVVVAATGPLARVGFGKDLHDGDHVERADVSVTRGRTVGVRSTGEETFRCNADGEISAPMREASWLLHDAAWAVLAPPVSRPVERA